VLPPSGTVLNDSDQRHYNAIDNVATLLPSILSMRCGGFRYNILRLSLIKLMFKTANSQLSTFSLNNFNGILFGKILILLYNFKNEKKYPS